jgi:hypothetical protein
MNSPALAMLAGAGLFLGSEEGTKAKRRVRAGRRERPDSRGSSAVWTVAPPGLIRRSPLRGSFVMELALLPGLTPGANDARPLRGRGEVKTRAKSKD